MLPDQKTTDQLIQIHKSIGRRYRKPDLSGDYLATENILHEHPESVKSLSFHEGRMQYGSLELAPVRLYELKHYGITLLGQPASSLPIHVSRADVNSFLQKNINTYWKNWIQRHSSWFNQKFLLYLFPRLTEWSVLGVARQLFTLHTGKIVSKTEAGLYCLNILPEKFHPVINLALSIRQNNRSYPFVQSYAIRPSWRRTDQTIECVNYIINCFNKHYEDSEKVRK